jgi:hypothetical protein
VFDPTGADRDLAADTVLQVSILRHGYRPVLRLRYRTEVLDADCAARIAGYHLTALTLIAADPDGEHGRQRLLSGKSSASSSRGWCDVQFVQPDSPGNSQPNN